MGEFHTNVGPENEVQKKWLYSIFYISFMLSNIAKGAVLGLP
jgi:hypothetical protein